MRVKEGERLLPELQRIGIAAHMRMRQRQEHAGVVVGVLHRIGDAAVDVERAHEAALLRAALARHEGDAMGDQPVRRPVPAARLGHREGIDLPRQRTHALGLHQRPGVEAQRLVKAAMALVHAVRGP